MGISSNKNLSTGVLKSNKINHRKSQNSDQNFLYLIEIEAQKQARLHKNSNAIRSKNRTSDLKKLHTVGR